MTTSLFIANPFSDDQIAGIGDLVGRAIDWLTDLFSTERT